jgi:beta-fructofuranosidase
MNDPNGLVHWQGAHHVFHQSDPDSLWFGTMSWGHVSSTDLLHWQRDEAALVPSQPPDRDGCWTGCVVDVDGVATAIYTGVVALGNDQWTQTICLATATDPGLRIWGKHPGNPVEVEPPGFPVTAFRDPYVWRDDSGWVMLLGSSLPSGEGAVLCYRSGDLLRWSYEGVAISGSELPEGLWTGAVWECPALIPVSADRHLLLFSVADPSKTPVLNYPVAVTGRFDGARFRPETMDRFDHGHDCYAPAVETTVAGRFLAYGWSWEGLTGHGREEQGWAGCLTLPREIGFRDGQVTYRLGADLTSLRSGHWGIRDASLAAGGAGLEHTAGSEAAEIRLVLELATDSGFDLVFRSSPDGQEQTVIRYRAPGASLEFDRDRSSLSPEAAGGVSRVRFPLPATGIMELTLVIDHSVAELFVGDSVVMTERIYPQRADSTTVRLNAVGRGTTVRSFDVWELSLAPPDGRG